jgi:hypothetical protein
MVLDKKLNGILDQGAGDLILFDQVETDVRLELMLGRLSATNCRCIDSHFWLSVRLSVSFISHRVSAQKTYEDALATIKEMGSVVDKLYSRASKLN